MLLIAATATSALKLSCGRIQADGSRIQRTATSHGVAEQCVLEVLDRAQFRSLLGSQRRSLLSAHGVGHSLCEGYALSYALVAFSGKEAAKQTNLLVVGIVLGVGKSLDAACAVVQAAAETAERFFQIDQCPLPQVAAGGELVFEMGK